MNFHDIFDRPIAFQRPFVRLKVGITGALMLSQAVYWSKRTKDADGWFYKTMDEWEEETGLTRTEQETARKKLVEIKVLEQKKKGVPCRLYYRVDMEKIVSLLFAGTLHSSLQESCKQGCGNPASKHAEILHAITETTAESTTESTADIFPAEAAIATLPAAAEVFPRCEIPSDMPGPKDRNAKTFKAWANYAMAYRKRYGVWPVWNAQAGGMLGKLIDLVGVEAAPKVAAFYVSINDARLVNDCHGLKNLIAKAQAYHTQWATGRQMNGTTARQIEQHQANLTAGEEAARRIMERRSQGERNEFL